MDTEIVICKECKGTGKQEKSELMDPHHRDYDVWDEVCPFCNGFGRVRKIITYKKLNEKELAIRDRNSKEKEI